jgi:cell fate (sporulation/competence/biofilm development) regulator YlbF (YheA/YmcA/DUF963 family)
MNCYKSAKMEYNTPYSLFKEIKMTLTANENAMASAAVDIKSAVGLLAKEITASPVFEAFKEAAVNVSDDKDASALVSEIRKFQRLYQWDQNARSESAKKLEELQKELTTIPVYQNYMKAEMDLRVMLREIDQVIGDQTGVKFAENAVQSSCSGSCSSCGSSCG